MANRALPYGKADHARVDTAMNEALLALAERLEREGHAGDAFAVRSKAKVILSRAEFRRGKLIKP